MKTALSAVALGLVVVLLIVSWQSEATPVPEVAGVPETPPVDVGSAAAASPPVDSRREVAGAGVETSRGPTGVRVTCVWKADGEPAARIPVTAWRLRGDAYDRVESTAATDAGGIAIFTDLAPLDHAFRVGATEARIRVTAGELAELRLVLPVEATIGGIVVDEHEVPVAAAQIFAEVGGIARLLGTSGDDGRFVLRQPTMGGIYAGKEGHLPSQITRVKDGAEDVVLRLAAAGGSLSGVVLDADGRAAGHAAVMIAIDPVADGGAADSARPAVLLDADANGRFTTTQVPASRVLVYATARGAGFGQEWADASVPGAQVVVRLRRAASIHGVVLGGESGDVPRRGIPLEIHRQRDLPGLLQGTSDELTRATALTDENGRYRFDDVPPGRMWVALFAGKDVIHHNVLLQDGEDHEWNPDLRPPAGVIRGVLSGPDGEVLAGWELQASRTDLIDMKFEHQKATTDQDGRFEIRGLRPFPHAVQVQAPDSSQVVARREEVAPDAPPFEWRLRGLPSQSGVIVGVLLDSRGAPPAECKLRATCDGVTRNADAVANPPGAFRIEGVIPGRWVVTGSTTGYGSFELGTCVVAPAATFDFGVHSLPARGAVVVRVRGADFVPRGIEITLEQVSGGQNRVTLRPDGDMHRCDPLPPGRYRLRATGENFALATREVVVQPGVDTEVGLDATAATGVVLEFVPEELEGDDWKDSVSFVVRDAAGGEVWKRTLSVAGAPTARRTVGLPAGAYSIEASSPNLVHRRGHATFVVPAAGGPLGVRVALVVQAR
ncbi:MAG: carboxypeptidase regulatory-like domain-containing protein [Planctomycetota bacterium]